MAHPAGAEEEPPVLEVLGDGGIGVLEELAPEAGPVEGGQDAPGEVDREQGGQPVLATHLEVAVGGGDVHDPGAVLEGHEVVREDAVGLAQVDRFAPRADALEQGRVAQPPPGPRP